MGSPEGVVPVSIERFALSGNFVRMYAYVSVCSLSDRFGKRLRQAYTALNPLRVVRSSSRHNSPSARKQESIRVASAARRSSSGDKFRDSACNRLRSVTTRSPEDAAQLLLGFGPRYLRTAHPPQRRECEVDPVAASDDDRTGRERYAFDEHLGRHFVERNPPLQHETPAANPAGIDEGRLIVEIGEQISCAALGIETVGDRTRYTDGRRALPADVDCRKQKKQINKWMFHNGGFKR